mmetsp:Transcript_22452/g.44094  ORF Transcript_22452/g.44094 Transcript_22452/m.44094 type:complete len:630 (+) Transcript_22452:183-2072(+)|eukprot:CAMPEP_0171491334 /NCGR_PEP_ID=MMETSP0958-20121227/3803_1 /TAXON_ID=87120 /ORGANISM="Aurantiochytrium limacinum, Strain ATCCMYA-1381" /LENGTH=629 /DNA_ID=CAMNT_0012024743 /DNA_START=111 /DNA_END=2000 /DNA_ORIENTATION=-
MIPPPPPDEPPPASSASASGADRMHAASSPRYTGVSSSSSSSASSNGGSPRSRFQDPAVYGNSNNHSDRNSFGKSASNYGGNMYVQPGSASNSLAMQHVPQPQQQKARKDRAAELELRQVAETLSKTGKVLNAGLTQANEQGQRLRGAIAKLERAREWSTAERTRAQDEISAYFHNLHEVLRAKEAELLRDCKGVYEVQDDDQSRRLEELVHEGQRLSKACTTIQSLNEGTANATLGSLNEPLNALLEALESSAKAIENEEELSMQDAARLANGPSSAGDAENNALAAPGGGEDRGVKFYFCQDKEIQRSIEGIEMVHFEQVSPPVVLVGTPSAVDEEARRRRLLRDGPAGGLAGHAQASPRVTPPHQEMAGLRLDGQFASPMSRGTGGKSAGHGNSSANGGAGGNSRMPEKRLSGATPRRYSGEMDNNGLADSAYAQTYKIKAVIPFEDDEDPRGVVHYLGTRANTQVFSNPALFSPDDESLIVLRASSRIEGDLASLSAFKHHDGAFFETDSALSSWVSIELPSPMAPSHYTLGYYVNGQDHIPRNWVLQGSKDNTNWATLKVHENDTSLDGKLHLSTWRIPERAVSQAGPFRFFRVMQTGPTSTGTMFLVLSFLELYGTLFTEADL